MPEHHILNLGAGVQSTALYLMSIDGDDPLVPKFDAAIFADTQEEPDEVYRHLEWLESLGGPKIVRVTAGKLGDALEAGSDARGNRRTDGAHYIQIPVYTKMPDGTVALTRRQCTNDYKVKPIEKEIRVMAGSGPGRPLPKGVTVVQYMGLSRDEPKRVIRVKQRFMDRPAGWAVKFPLFEMEYTRSDCFAYLAGRVPHTVPRSACVFCPFKKNEEWRYLRDNDESGWSRAIHIDSVCRTGEGIDAHRYVHRDCVPLADADLRDSDAKSGQLHLQGFQDECEGYCGN